MGATSPYPRKPTMNAQPLPALTSGDPSAWDQALYRFLVEKGNRSGSRRTVESYSRMLWPFFAERSLTTDRVKPGDVLGWVHGIGRSGRTPSSTTVAKVGAERWWEYPQAALGTRPLSEDGDLEWFVA